MRSMQLKNVYVGTCTMCFQGLCFNETVYYCIDCNIDVCTSCQPSHSFLHATSIVRITSLPWPPQPGVAEATASCSECSLEVKCRLECSDCSSCLCQECSGSVDRRRKWYEHRTQHQRIKGFIFLCSPLEEVSPSTPGQCDCLTVRGCISHCFRCYRVMKLGECIYSCRTCRREYNTAQEICQECFVAVQTKHHGHEFGSMLLHYVNEGSDDADSQFRRWWRCTAPGCNLVVGPTVEWLHRHPDARLCIGDALMDHYRKCVWKDCPKTYQYRSQLRDPANPAEKMTCSYCDRSIAWDVWNEWCYTCDEFTCKDCVEDGRAAHRHPLAWTRVVKKAPIRLTTQFNFNDKRSCDRCGSTVFTNMFQGMECTICRDYHCCTTCLQKQVRPQHPVCKGRQAAFDFWLIRD